MNDSIEKLANGYGPNRNPFRSVFWPTLRDSFPSDGRSFQKLYASWLIRLRWLAIAVIAGLAVLNQATLHYLDAEAMVGIWIALAVLLVLNISYGFLYGKTSRIDRYGLYSQIALDLIVLTSLLHFSGGIENPLAFAYVFHVILSSIVFERRIAMLVVIFSTILFGLLAFGEYAEYLHHYTLSAFPHFEGEHGEEHAAHDLTYVSARVGLHFLFMALSSGFVTALMDRLHGATREIRSERRQLQHVIRSTGIGLAIIEENGNISLLNPKDSIWQPIGGSSEDAIWLTWLREITTAASGDSPMTGRGYERSFPTTGGETRHYYITLSALDDEPNRGGSTIAALVSDVTEQKRIEAKMSHSARIAMLGKVSAGIAHEVGNPLASISTRLSLLEDSNSLEEIKSGLYPLKNLVARINRIVLGVSQIARPQQGSWTSFDLHSVINDTLEILRLHKGAKRCSIECRIPDEPLVLNGVKDQIGQVFLNLALNALDAMPDGGTLRIQCQTEQYNFHILFTDTGVGIPKENLSRIFDIFFTTKKNGLGIGMHLAYQSIEAHHGSIQVESEPGQGTRFSITLPRDGAIPAEI